METIELQKLKYAIIASVPEAIITDVRLIDHFDFISNEVVAQVIGIIWSQQLEEIKYPRDWWQAIKDRWFPNWLKERYPVIYTIVDVKAKYPKYKLMPEEVTGKAIVFTMPPREYPPQE